MGQNGKILVLLFVFIIIKHPILRICISCHFEFVVLFTSSITLLPANRFELQRIPLHHGSRCVCVQILFVYSSIHFTLFVRLCAHIQSRQHCLSMNAIPPLKMCIWLFCDMQNLKTIDTFSVTMRKLCKFSMVLLLFFSSSLSLPAHSLHNNILNAEEIFIFATSVLHDKYLCENIHVNWISYKKCNIPIWMEQGEIMWRDKENVWPFEKEWVCVCVSSYHILKWKYWKMGRIAREYVELAKKGRI